LCILRGGKESSYMQRFILLASLAAVVAGGCGGSQQKKSETALANATTPVATPAGERAATQPVPTGFFSVTPGLMVEDVDAALSFYSQAFGAITTFKIPGIDGKTEHAQIKLGDSTVMVALYHPSDRKDELKPPKKLGGTPGSLNYAVEDVDAVFQRAVAAGAQIMMPVKNQFWGDRWGMLQDPFGHQWGIGTSKVKLSDAQMRQLAPLAFQPQGQRDIDKAWKNAPKADGYKQKDHHDITPALHVKDPSKAMDFYKSGLGAEEREKMNMRDGRLMHAEIKVGDSIVMLGEEMPEYGVKSPISLDGSSFFLYVYLPEVDKATTQAKRGGAAKIEGPSDMFWGDRVSFVVDPSGHVWTLATHTRDVTPEEMKQALKQMGHKQ
jgi:uncharacterized glyoxalase superfamily protein PhnB